MWKGREKQCTVRVIKSRSPVDIDKHDRSLESSGAQVISPMNSALSKSGDECDSTFTSNRTYFRVCYNNNHFISGCCDLMEDTYFIGPRKRNYEAISENEGDYRRKMKYPVSRHIAPSAGHSSPQRKLNYKNSCRRTIPFPVFQGAWSN